MPKEPTFEPSQQDDLAECIGLWLAEGDSTTIREITVTNNCTELIRFFHETITCNFSLTATPRLYRYAPQKDCKDDFELAGVIKKYYSDHRANKPYYIYRIGSTQLVRQWKAYVEEAISDENRFAGILRGFFAGEGSVCPGKRNVRRIRIAQGHPNKLIEKMLDFFKITYTYWQRNRTYEISGVENLKRIEALDLTKLHPEKRNKFKLMMGSYKQKPQIQGIGLRKIVETKRKIMELLDSPATCRALSKKLDRTFGHTQDALTVLRKEGKMERFKADGTFFWVKTNSKVVVVSKVKKQILQLLANGKMTLAEIAKNIGSSQRAIRNRLEELKRYKIIQTDYKFWQINPSGDKMIVVGIDEAGRKPE